VVRDRGLRLLPQLKLWPDTFSVDREPVRRGPWTVPKVTTAEAVAWYILRGPRAREAWTLNRS